MIILKKLIIFLVILKSSFTFSQNFNDKIIPLTGDTIKCQIISITDKNIIYKINTPVGSYRDNIYFSYIKDYILDKNSKPKINLKHTIDNTTIPVQKDSILAYIKQADSIALSPFRFTNSYAINVEALIVRDIKLTYTHLLFNRSYLETMLSYNFPFSEGGRMGKGDPFNDYGRIQLRLGLKNYYKRRAYINPMLLFGYGSFDNKWVSDRSGGYHNNTPQTTDDYLVNRDKIESEILLKLGWTMHHKHFMQEVYYGLGYRYSILDDNINEENINSVISYPQGSAAKRTLTSHSIELHFGFQLGYCK